MVAVVKKRHLKSIGQVKIWQLLILLLLAGFLSATFLRLNYIGMKQRREAVLEADVQGDPQVTSNRLYELQRYISDHMNTNLGKGIYLEGSYKRAVQLAYDTASVDTNPNGNIYKKAQEVCAPQFTSWSTAYIECTTVELAKYPAAGDLVSLVNLPRTDSYLHSFVSPLWSPDFAGWSVAVCAAILLIIIVRLTGTLVIRFIINRRYKSI